MENTTVPKVIQCKTCKNNTAKLQSYTGDFSTYFCNFCKTTFAGSNEKGFDVMGKKNKKKKNKNKNQKGVGFVTKSSATDDSWETEIDCVKECSKVPERVIIWIMPLAKRKIDVLMEEYKNIEWLAYLIGKKEEKEIHDIFIPEQEITATSVDNIQCDEWNDILPVGVIHSHHGMGHSFSGTDNEWINQNHDISLVISSTGIAGQARLKTDCGAYKIVPVDVKLKVDLEFDDAAFIESVKDKIQKKTYGTTYYGYGARTWDNQYGWQPPHASTSHTGAGTVSPPDEDVVEATTFLSEVELNEIDQQIDELDFEKELSLAEELDLLEETSNLDDKEAN